MEGTTKQISLETLSQLFKEQGDEATQQEEVVNEIENVDEEVVENNEEEVGSVGTEENVSIAPKETILTKTIKSLLDKGTWTDYSLNIDGEDYESIEDLISKIEITEDLFEALAEKQLEVEKNELKSKSISIEGVDETRVKIIEAIKNGLNYEPLLEINDNHIQPLKDMDLSDERQAEVVCYERLKMQYGEDLDFIQYKLNQLKEQGLLESTAEEVRQEYITEFEKMMSDKTLEMKQAQEEANRKVKENKKELRATLKEKEYNDVFSKKVVDFIYEKDQEGKEDWYSIVKSKLEDKDFATKFAHFVLDEEDFINKQFADFKRKDKISTLEKLNITVSTNKSKDGGRAPEKEKDKSTLFSSDVKFIESFKKKPNEF